MIDVLDGASSRWLIGRTEAYVDSESLVLFRAIIRPRCFEFRSIAAAILEGVFRCLIAEYG